MVRGPASSSHQVDDSVAAERSVETAVSRRRRIGRSARPRHAHSTFRAEIVVDFELDAIAVDALGNDRRRVDSIAWRKRWKSSLYVGVGGSTPTAVTAEQSRRRMSRSSASASTTARPCRPSLDARRIKRRVRVDPRRSPYRSRRGRRAPRHAAGCRRGPDGVAADLVVESVRAAFSQLVGGLAEPRPGRGRAAVVAPSHDDRVEDRWRGSRISTCRRCPSCPEGRSRASRSGCAPPAACRRWSDQVVVQVLRPCRRLLHQREAGPARRRPRSGLRPEVGLIAGQHGARGRAVFDTPEPMSTTIFHDMRT